MSGTRHVLQSEHVYCPCTGVAGNVPERGSPGITRFLCGAQQQLLNFARIRARSARLAVALVTVRRVRTRGRRLRATLDAALRSPASSVCAMRATAAAGP